MKKFLKGALACAMVVPCVTGLVACDGKKVDKDKMYAAISSADEVTYRPDGSIDTYMIERFADVGRYEYAYNNGYFNDYGWTLHDINGESDYWSSNRFWVWIDYKFSTEKVDILKRMNTAVYNKTFSSDDYGTDGKAWDAIFEGTDAAGKTITQLWDMYAADDFSKCSAKSRSYGSKSQLIKTYNVREIVKSRYN